jgi:phosphoesterase RecJ-like protein
MISKIISEDLIHKTEKLIDASEKIAIVVHTGPDGDAMGASLGLWHYLMTIEKEPVVIVPDALPSFLKWMPGTECLLVYSESAETCEKMLTGADLIFALDFNVLTRVGKMENALRNAKAPKILVDHHLHPEDFAKVTISYPEISSTSELVFRLICRMGNFSKINLAGAECILTGMMTDTGGFSYNSNSPEIYSIVHELLKLGVDKDEIFRKVFNTFSESRLRLTGYALYEKMKIYPANKAALITLNAEELKRFDYQIGDTEGLVNMPLSIENVIFSVFMREDRDKIKVSLRSVETFPANKVSSDLFNGGGHLNAAGGECYTSLEEAVRKFEEALDDYKDFL